MKALYRTHVKHRLAGLRRLLPYDIHETVVMTGSPRGGTTWLSQILAADSESSLVWEPLSLDRVPSAARRGFDWRTYFPAEDEGSPEALEYMDGIFRAPADPYTISQTKVVRHLLAKRLVVKFVRAQMLLPWMTHHFAIRKPILLIRHPCAVVSSRLRWGAGLEMEVPRYPTVMKHFPHFEEILQTVETVEERLAAQWAIEFAVALQTPRPWPFTLTSYESLVRFGEREVERLFAALELPTPKDVGRLLRRPSMTTAADSHVLEKKDPLVGWTKKLDSDQVERILRVTRAFGVTVYDEGLEPDYEALGLPTF